MIQPTLTWTLMLDKHRSASGLHLVTKVNLGNILLKLLPITNILLHPLPIVAHPTIAGRSIGKQQKLLMLL